jgi:hypothetical protein
LSFRARHPNLRPNIDSVTFRTKHYSQCVASKSTIAAGIRILVPVLMRLGTDGHAPIAENHGVFGNGSPARKALLCGA